jgi:hypothetical protein
MSSQVQISVSVLGAQSSGQQLQQLGNTAAIVQTRVNQLSARREFMMGQQLQAITGGMVGADSGVLRALDSVERLQYVARASGISISDMFVRFAPAAGVAIAVAAIGGALMAMADRGKQAFASVGVGSDEFFRNLSAGIGLVDMFNLKLRETKDAAAAAREGLNRGQKEINRTVEDAGSDATPRKKAERELEDVRTAEEKKISALEKRGAELEEKRKAAGTSRNEDLTRLYQEATGRTAPLMRTPTGTLRLQDEAAAGFAAQIKANNDLINKAREDGLAKEKTTAEKIVSAKKDELAKDKAEKDQKEKQTEDQKRFKERVDARARWDRSQEKLKQEKEAKDKEDRQQTLSPWLAEMQNPKGFASTTLSNSIEGVRAVNLAATMGERTDATQRALAEQVRLLEDIRNNTGNQNQTVTVGAL